MTLTLARNRHVGYRRNRKCEPAFTSAQAAELREQFGTETSCRLHHPFGAELKTAKQIRERYAICLLNHGRFLDITFIVMHTLMGSDIVGISRTL